MKRSQWKSNFLQITLLVFTTATISSLTSCSGNQNQNQTQNPTDTNTVQPQGDAMADHNMSMDLGPADAKFDLRFIDGMSLHHKGAIVMAKEAQQKSKRPEIGSIL